MSQPQPEPVQDPQGTSPEPQPEPEPEPDWKAQARKWEARAKENATAAKRLAEIEAANQTAQEKAEAAARQAEERATVALHRAASSDIRAALTEAGIPNAASITEDLNISRFVADDGEINGDAVSALVEKWKPFIPPPGPRAPAPNPAQGGGGTPMTLNEIIIGLESRPAGERSATENRELARHKARMALGRTKG